MGNVHRLTQCVASVAVLLATLTHAASAQAPQGARPAAAPAPEKPATAPPAGNFELYEWVVIVADPNYPAANAQTMFRSTLPEFVGSQRPAPEVGGAADASATKTSAAAAGEPSPVGVIRVVGGAADDGTKVDVLLQLVGGRFLGQWPKGKSRADRQLWEAYELKSAPGPGQKEVSAGHWFNSLREVGSHYLQRGRAGDRFLLYDAELNYPLPLRVTAADAAGYVLSNSGGAALHDVTVFRPAEGGWVTGSLPTIGAGKGVPPASGPSTRQGAGPATQPGSRPSARPSTRAAAPAAAAEALFVEGPGAAPTRRPATSPATAAATQPAGTPTTAALKVGAKPAAAADALAAWRERLTREGFAEGDVRTILRVLERHALDKRRLTAVYRLDPAEMDRLLPLEVTPTPRKTVRVGLVVARSIDPSVANEVDQLIAQLGHAEWEQREAASKQLAELGAAAKPKLEAALKQKDMEVVWRAEKLLHAFETGPQQPRRR